ncbi:DUF2231 domain-containing protein [Dictyobacter arantiisoli]|uniref:DUF2231 domain-containing protein n=1 Tax=Dictyobacter arantiisoli TaxID=2014874 RepID=A0A5A5T972_9CHLR|nr:DUF2231 domain-containing protein [Dictyobacter arantiisoli]GCF07952.1 hypothetical protein KDI_15160 [Dictyobacter arantiisoli]
MKDPVVKGHPLHAMLSDLPIGMTVAGVCFDLLGRLTPLSQLRFAAKATLSLAFVSGIVTALTGLWDYQAVPGDHPARRSGALHGYLNASALVLLLTSLILRQRPLKDKEVGTYKSSSGAQISSLVALFAMVIAGWFGGETVFTHGWRVTPAEYDQLLEEDLAKSGQKEHLEKVHAIVYEYKQAHTLIP